MFDLLFVFFFLFSFFGKLKPDKAFYFIVFNFLFSGTKGTDRGFLGIMVDKLFFSLSLFSSNPSDYIKCFLISNPSDSSCVFQISCSEDVGFTASGVLGE